MDSFLEWLNIATLRDAIWVGIGLVAQLMFSARFLVQWITSEREGKSVIPVAFWYLSLAGGVTLLAYGLYRGEPAIILGQFFGTVVYSRNLWLIHAERHTAA